MVMLGRQVYLSGGISTKLGFGIAFIRVYVLAWLVVMLDQHLRVTQTNRALVKRNSRREARLYTLNFGGGQIAAVIEILFR